MRSITGHIGFAVRFLVAAIRSGRTTVVVYTNLSRQTTYRRMAGTLGTLFIFTDISQTAQQVIHHIYAGFTGSDRLPNILFAHHLGGAILLLCTTVGTALVRYADSV